MIRLNLCKFMNLQKEMTEVDMAKKLRISRSQLWRIKKKNCSVGEKFISGFREAFPQESFDDYFFT